MQLREAGLSFEKIAQTVGYGDRGSAYKAVMAGLKARLEPRRQSGPDQSDRKEGVLRKTHQGQLGGPVYAGGGKGGGGKVRSRRREN
jgi:hypothetical protein